MILDLGYWAYIGTFYLLYLTYQDYKNNRWVDDRKNYFMMGLTISLLSHIDSNIWYLLGLIVIVIAFQIFIRKQKLIGSADSNTLLWIFMAYGIMGWNVLTWFAIIFIVLTSLHAFMKFKIFKYKGFVPFYGVLLLCYVLNNLLFRLY